VEGSKIRNRKQPELLLWLFVFTGILEAIWPSHTPSAADRSETSEAKARILIALYGTAGSRALPEHNYETTSSLAHDFSQLKFRRIIFADRILFADQV
jgi:hypothetical protein